MTKGFSNTNRWPALPYDEWKDTLGTLHMWTQVVGKVKLALSPYLNQWWHIGFNLSATGLTTGPIATSRNNIEIAFDFVHHQLHVYAGDGDVRVIDLRPQSVADFYQEFQSALKSLDINVNISALPSEVPNPVRFDEDTTHGSYDANAVTRWWTVLSSVDLVLQRYRSTFAGKSSPILFYWGSFDLNATRFCGLAAEPPAGAPRFLQLAENQENIACGFWPGNATMSGMTLGEPAFYSYCYPAPAGIAEAVIKPKSAHFSNDYGEFIYSYADARTAPDPDAAILEFFQTTYEVQADLAGWDRSTLEQHDIPQPASV